MIIGKLLFYIFATLTILGALGVITARNPVHAVLFLIFAFFNSAATILLLGAEFLAMIIIIVYVGAVAVLFLFVVMMLNVNFEKMRSGFLSYFPVCIMLATIFMVDLYFVINSFDYAIKYSVEPIYPIYPDERLTNTHAIGQILYTDFFYNFQIAGVILFVAMVSSIVLTHRKRPGVKRQKIDKQLSRDPKKTMKLIKMKSGAGIDDWSKF